MRTHAHECTSMHMHKHTHAHTHAFKHTADPNMRAVKTLDRDYYMDARQAAEWGIVDEVIDARSEKMVISQ